MSSGTAAVTAAWLANWLWPVALFVPLAILPAWFPDRTWRFRLPVSIVGGGGLLIMMIGLASAARIDLSETESVPSPVALPVGDALFLVGSVLTVLYGERDDPTRALLDIADALALTTDAEDMVRSVTARLQRALRVPCLMITGPHGLEVTAGSWPSWGDAGHRHEVPLRHLGVVLGRRTIVQRGPNEPLRRRDLDLVEQVCGPIAAAVAAAGHVIELRRSRQRIVAAREEERRRLRRDLHDGVGPLLSALRTHADVAALRLDRDPAGAAAALAAVCAISDTALADLRRAISGLAPTMLAELGLGEALRAVAADLSSDRVAVRVDSDAPLPELAPATEVAAFHIAAEAANNAVRHGAPERVTISVTTEHDDLVIVITDDGTGLPERPRPGVGLDSMQERAAELEGVVTLRSDPSGTTVHARLPRQIRSWTGDQP